jgi:hypothetical protein
LTSAVAGPPLLSHYQPNTHSLQRGSAFRGITPEGMPLSCGPGLWPPGTHLSQCSVLESARCRTQLGWCWGWSTCPRPLTVASSGACHAWSCACDGDAGPLRARGFCCARHVSRQGAIWGRIDVGCVADCLSLGLKLMCSWPFNWPAAGMMALGT